MNLIFWMSVESLGVKLWLWRNPRAAPLADALGWVDFVVATNSGPMCTFLQAGTRENRPLALRFRGRPGNPSAVGLRATLALEDGST